MGLLVIFPAIAVVHAIPMAIYHSADLDKFGVSWLTHIHAKGWSAFSAPFGNYSPTYLYLLRVASPLLNWLSRKSY
ncbi:hypothetical protein [Sphingomonas daechungensis]|nr:hypothetical protein [Sphingomonas daechungensis]